MKIKVIIAGGNGFIGHYFRKRFKEEGFEVIAIGRNPTLNSSINWNDDLHIKNALNNSGILINLAGKSVNCRYNSANKAEIISSRINTTQRLSDLICQVDNPPKLWLNASTATIYRHAEDHAMTETGGEIGTGFSVEVAQQWEKTFFETSMPFTRRVALRMTIVLGKNGGVINPLTNLVKCFLGGKQGNGRQMFSWIHIEDLFRIILFTWENKNLSGVLNCASPNPVSKGINGYFSKNT